MGFEYDYDLENEAAIAAWEQKCSEKTRRRKEQLALRMQKVMGVLFLLLSPFAVILMDGNLAPGIIGFILSGVLLFTKNDILSVKEQDADL